jgi:antirestriction protein
MREPPTNSDDVFDMRDAIARFEELEQAASRDGADEAEFKALSELLDETKGSGGDEQWRGDWYPVTMVRDSYFKAYAEELAEELDLIPGDAKWPANCIDWEQAARELQMDYTSAEFDGVTYWYR